MYKHDFTYLMYNLQCLVFPIKSDLFEGITEICVNGAENLEFYIWTCECKNEMGTNLLHSHN